MIKVEIEFSICWDIYGEDEILDTESITFKKELNLKNMQKVSDYLVEDLYDDINKYLENQDYLYHYFEHYPDTEEGFKYMCKKIDIKLDGIKLKGTKDEYNKIMVEPFED